MRATARRGSLHGVREVTGGEGVDATVNVSDAKSAAGLACAITKMHAKMIQIAQVGSHLNLTSWFFFIRGVFADW